MTEERDMASKGRQMFAAAVLILVTFGLMGCVDDRMHGKDWPAERQGTSLQDPPPAPTR